MLRIFYICLFCFNIGFILLYSNIAFASSEQENQDLIQACGKDDYKACDTLSTNFVLSDKLTEALPYLEKACDHDMPDACNFLGLRYHFGDVVKKNETKAKQYLEKACNLNSGWACQNYALFFIYESRDRNKAKNLEEILRKSCDLNNYAGCGFLGQLYWQGDIFKKDVKLSAKFYQKSCDIEENDSCYSAWLLCLNEDDETCQIYGDKTINFESKNCKEEKNIESCKIVSSIYLDDTYKKQNYSKSLLFSQLAKELSEAENKK